MTSEFWGHKFPLMLLSIALAALSALSLSHAAGSAEAVANDTAAQIESLYSENGGRSQFPQITQDVIEATLYAEDAVAVGEFASAKSIIDNFLSQYPYDSSAWGGATYPSNLNLGRPAGYYGIRMLDEIARQGLAHPLQASQPLTLTVVTVGCAVGIQPTNIEFTETQAVSHSLKSAITNNDHFVLRQGAQLFRQYINAITSRERHVQMRFYAEEATCAEVTSPNPPGRWIGPTNTTSIIDALPDHVKDSSDMYWFVYPSNIPETPEFEGYEFISGATNRYDGRMVFMMDDRWILKNPPHLGTGVTSEVERRMYNPQWMQHEYFHHLFLSEFPEFELENSSHQWFWRENWPADFASSSGREADYYAEALNKRFYDASPTVTQRLSHATFSNSAVRVYSESDHNGRGWGISQGIYDQAEVSRSPVGDLSISSLEINYGYEVTLCTESGGNGICETFTSTQTQLSASLNNAVSYIEVRSVLPSNVVGHFERESVQNGSHIIDLIHEQDSLWWTDATGVRCPLFWDNGSLNSDATCPYGEQNIGVSFDGAGRVAALVINSQSYYLQRDIVGYYEKRPVQNNWHRVEIVRDDEGLWYTNAADRRCPLHWNGNTLMEDASCPYGEREITVEMDEYGRVTGLRISGQFYTYLDPIGFYERNPVENNSDQLEIVRDGEGLWLNSAAGERCSLTWVDSNLVEDASCAYGQQEIVFDSDVTGNLTALVRNDAKYYLQREVVGYYERQPVENDWHKVNIVQDDDGIWWTNEAGVRCSVSWDGGTLKRSASCPYGESEVGLTLNEHGHVIAVLVQGETYQLKDVGISRRGLTGPVPTTEPEPENPIENEPENPTQTLPVDIYVDSDQDGVPDATEAIENTNPDDDASFSDSDNDGVADFIDTDSDGDGIGNNQEHGGNPYVDRDRDGVPAYLDDNDYNNTVGDENNAVQALFDPDGNGVASFREINNNSVDTDNDQVPDLIESVNGTDPNDSMSFLDFDNDGTADYIDTDDDNDGIEDVIEGDADADGDGIPNLRDTDSDGDGISDAIEGLADVNGDSIPNFLDDTTRTTTPVQDQDNDGIDDSVEGTADADNDGIPNLLDEDSDSDLIADLIETNADYDADGIPNYLDTDSDGDHINDLVEGSGDNDGDSVANFIDLDSDADGISDEVETSADSDDDGVADFLDSDSANNNQQSLSPMITTGSGCSIVGNTATFDPVLILLLCVSFLMLWRGKAMRHHLF